MIQSGAGIHDYEPSTKEMAQIYDADVFVHHSQTLESWAGRLGSQSSRFQSCEWIEGSQGNDPLIRWLKRRTKNEGVTQTLDKVTVWRTHKHPNLI